MTFSIKNKFLIFFSFLLTVLLITYLFFDFIQFPEHMETCKSNLIIEKSNAKVSSLILLHLFNNRGVIELHGFYTLKDELPKKLERQISFNVMKNKNKYVLSDNKIKVNDNEVIIDKDIGGVMPDFFLHDHSVLILDKKSSIGNEKAFLRSGLPFLYCFNS